MVVTFSLVMSPAGQHHVASTSESLIVDVPLQIETLALSSASYLASGWSSGTSSREVYRSASVGMSEGSVMLVDDEGDILLNDLDTDGTE